MSAPPEPRANPLLVGHDAPLALFERALRSDRLPHAWLIEGPRGIGKATFAFRLARRLLAGAGVCPNEPEGALFRQVANGSHPDLRVLEREINPKSKRRRDEIVVDDVRDALEAMAATSAWRGRRVLVVDAADETNPNAANALLKFLEEPPPDAVILLVCHNPGRVLPTVLSRCARLKLKPLAEGGVAGLLPRLDPDLTPAEAKALAALAGGSPGRAFDLREHGILQTYGLVLRTLASSLSPAERALQALGHLERPLAGGVALASGVLLDVVHRKAMLAAGRPPDPPLVDDEAGRLEALAPGLPLDRWLTLWNKLARLPGRVEGLNLDPKQALLLAGQAVAEGRPGLVDGDPP
ncbi:MAG: DNA polymerase III subunit delta' [Geminicoccaceae bacterium]|nr:DNA polymerase III subunit delta' [Geminicoccaceae bacterium]